MQNHNNDKGKLHKNDNNANLHSNDSHPSNLNNKFKNHSNNKFLKDESPAKGSGTDKSPSNQNNQEQPSKEQPSKDQHNKQQDRKGHNSNDSLTDVLEKIEPEEKSGKTSIGDIMEILESRGFGPLLFAPALIAVMPTGGVPGVPTVCGVIISLLSVQMILGKSNPWLPQFINDIDFENKKLEKGVSYAKKVTNIIDKISKPRLEQLSTETAQKIIAVICTLAALSMIPLEALPFAVMLPASSIILIAIGLITKDGYITLAALLLNLGTLYLLISNVLGG